MQRLVTSKNGSLFYLKSRKCSAPIRSPNLAMFCRKLRRGALATGFFVLGVAWAAQSSWAANAPPVMAIPGAFNVSGTGAFTYTIPITVPPGTAGMVPALTLNYSSQSGNGFEGLGWTLGGLPAITRCPQTTAQDGVHGSVGFNADDRFCLNGQRLVVTNGKPYGASGAEYSTEIESFSRIISYNQSGSGPLWFKVWTKAGQVMEFGDTADSRAPLVTVSGSETGPTGTVRAWAVNKISDAVGNYLTVIYNNGTPDTTYGQIYPTRINYTANDNAATGPLLAFSSVRLTYSGRGDQVPTYQAGSLVETTMLLSHITTYYKFNLVSDYQLVYTPAGSGTQYNELKSVTQCDNAGVCLAPTTFTWHGSRDTLTMTAQANGITQESKNISPGDFNGDGLIDLAITNQPPELETPLCANDIYLGTQSSDFTQSTMTANYSHWYNEDGGGNYIKLPYNGKACFNSTNFPAPIDFDADGYTDILLVEQDSATTTAVSTLFNDRSGHLGQASLFQDLTAGDFGDFNGDGRTDFLGALSNTNAFSAYISVGDGTFGPGPAFPGGNESIAAADFDGNGCADVLEQGDTNAIAFQCSPAVALKTVPDWSGAKIAIGDFNGDGKADILVTRPSSAGTLYLSTGTGITAQSFVVPSSWNNFTVTTGDWNGDGKTDIALISHAVGTAHQIWLSTGIGFVEKTTIPNNNAQDTHDVSAVAADWNNDGATDLWLKKPSGDTEYLFSYVPELIAKVDNGLGIVTTASYARLNKNGAFYGKGTSGTYPALDMDGPLYVVSRIDTGNGVGGTYSSTYSFAAAQANLAGRGFMGFASMMVTDLQTGIVQTTNYRQTYPYTGLIASQTRMHGSVTLNTTTNTYGLSNLGGTRRFVFLKSTVGVSNDLSGDPLPTVETDYTDYDGYGNVGTVTVLTTPPGGSSWDAKRVTVNTYNNDTDNWFLGQLTDVTTTSTFGSSTIMRESSFLYSAANGLLTRETIEPNSANTNLWLITAYDYDAFGNRTVVTAKGCPNAADAANPCTNTQVNNAARTTTTEYDADGRFVTKITNTAGESESWVHSNTFGLPTKHTGPNGLITTWTYDTFGHATNETRPDGTRTNTTYNYCDGFNGGSANCFANQTFMTSQTVVGSDNTTQIAPSVSTFYDGLSRAIMVNTQGFNGTLVRANTIYNDNGQVAQASRPYYVSDASGAVCSSGSNTYCTTFVYDALGRMTRATAADGGVTKTAYNGLCVTVTNARNEATASCKNDLGQVASVTDALDAADPGNHTTTYSYDGVGDLKAVTDPLGHAVRYNYDLRGRKIKSTDPDMGAWTYTYDSFGDLKSQTDAKGQVTTLTYDGLGRTTERVEPDMDSTWTYGEDAAHHNIDKLVSEGCTGAACADAGGVAAVTKTYAYDGKGRQSKLTTTIGTLSYFTQSTYDPVNGKIASVLAFSGFTVDYGYNATGYLANITDDSTGSLYWRASTRDAEAHLTRSILGNTDGTNHWVTQYAAFDPETGLPASICATNNAAPCDGDVANFGYTFDKVGNLTERTDAITGLDETSTYDALDRLTQARINGSPKNFGYDVLGNIINKAGVCNTAGCMAYGAGTAGPHALTSVAGTVNGVVNPTYAYDPDGNMMSGAGRSISYTSFNMTGTLAQSGALTSLWYGPDHQRVKMQTATSTTYYLNDAASNVMSERYVTGGVATWKNYVLADGHIVGLNSLSQGVVTLRYFVLDHLGSIAVVVDEKGHVLTDGAGHETGRLSYDAWGLPRNPDGTGASCALQASAVAATGTTRGFTGQEQLSDACVVNLNARLYDPTIGRFLAADSIVPDPLDGQAFNRYSYALNGPLSFTDPTGHDVETVVVLGHALETGNPAVIAAAAILELASDIFGIELFAATAPPPPAQVASVSVPNAAQSPVAGGNSTSVPPMQNTPVAPLDTVNPAPTSQIAANADATQTAAADYAGASPTSSSQIVSTSNPQNVETVVVTGQRTPVVEAGFDPSTFFQRILPRLLMGTDAHTVLLRYLQARDAGIRNWIGNTTDNGNFGTQRPDLIDKSATPHQVYEIKPNGQDLAAKTQLQGYLEKAGPEYEAGDQETVFQGLSEIQPPQSAGLFDGVTYTYYPGAYPGTIVYTSDVSEGVIRQIGEQFWKSFLLGPRESAFGPGSSEPPPVVVGP